MSHADKIIDLIKSLEKTSLALCQWLDHKILKSNPDICHLLISSNENVTIHVGKYEIENSEKLLGVELDWKLTFEDPISDVSYFQNCTIHRIIQETNTNERLF